MEGPFFFLFGLSWSDRFYILVGNTAENGNSEKHMVVVLAIIVSLENSSPSCDFFDRCYCSWCQNRRGFLCMKWTILVALSVYFFEDLKISLYSFIISDNEISWILFNP